jgi:hypothetical protein
MNTYTKKLLTVIGKCSFVEVPKKSDWLDIELTLGRSLPEDYKELLETIGTGSFGELCLLNPRAFNRCKLSIARLKSFCELQKAAMAEPFCALFPESEGLINIGIGSNNYGLFLKPLKHDWQLMFVDFDIEEITELYCGISEFIFGAINKSDNLPSWKRLRELFHIGGTPLFKPFISGPERRTTHPKGELLDKPPVLTLEERVRRATGDLNYRFPDDIPPC